MTSRRPCRREAVQLAGGDAVAIIGPNTTVSQNGTPLQGDAATSGSRRRRLGGDQRSTVRPEMWGQDEDGTPVPTFDAISIDITD